MALRIMRSTQMEKIFWNLNQQDFVINWNEVLGGVKDYFKVSGMGNRGPFTELSTQSGGDLGRLQF